MVKFHETGARQSQATLVLAHGAGAPMDSPFMNCMSEALAELGVGVLRFEFAYMAARRNGSRKPPPRADKLTSEFLDAIGDAKSSAPVFIGGKSMGGRVASMIAEDAYRRGAIAGIVCLGYPFHPPGKPDTLRTAHLEALSVPTLICQGTRDPFGTRQEVNEYKLSGAIDICFLEDGDHDFKPRKASGLTHAQNIRAAAKAISRWMAAR